MFLLKMKHEEKVKHLLEDIKDRIYQVKLRKRIRAQETVPELFCHCLKELVERQRCIFINN